MKYAHNFIGYFDKNRKKSSIRLTATPAMSLKARETYIIILNDSSL